MPERVSPRRYRARVEYDGTDFAGFQVNPGKRTVQGVLEDALARLGNGEHRRVDGAGRTDAGVHASGQVIAFSWDGSPTATELGKALEALLPADVAIHDLRQAPDGFKPRFAARYREYRYTVWNGPPSPLRERMALGVRVHATGQVIAFSWEGSHTATELGKALEALLPADVAVHDVRQAPDGFKPRFAARYREYRYTVWNGPPSPLRERMALGVRVPLDTAAMARAGSAFVGRHDFRAFGATDRSPVRTVMAVRVRQQGRLVTIDVRADSFLRGQVRRMVAVLLEVGLGKMDDTAVRSALAGAEPAFKGTAVPAKGLCLRHVSFGRRTGSATNGEHEER